MPDKEPNGTAERDTEDFVKNTLADIDKKLPKPPVAETFGQKLTIWVIRVFIALIAAGAVPGGTYAFSCGVKTAELRAASEKRKGEARLRQRQLQLKLLSQIIDIAKQADFKDPTSLYRLGLVAHMVNENTGVFGIQLKEAEETMDRMFDKLTPLSGLRRRLAESAILISDLHGRLKIITGNETVLESKVKELQVDYKKKTNQAAWKQRSLKRKIEEKQQELTEQRTMRAFYATRLFREQQLRGYFRDQLRRQAKRLRTALTEAADLRKSLKSKTDNIQELIKKLGKVKRSSKAAADLNAQLKKAFAEVGKENEKFRNAVKRLTSDLNSEREERKNLREAFKACLKKTCKTTLPVKPEVAPARKPKRKATPRRTMSGMSASRDGRAGRAAVRYQVEKFTVKAVRRPAPRRRSIRALKGVFAD